MYFSRSMYHKLTKKKKDSILREKDGILLKDIYNKIKAKD